MQRKKPKQIFFHCCHYKDANNRNKGKNSEVIFKIYPLNFTSLAALRSADFANIELFIMKKMQFFNIEFSGETKEKTFSETHQYTTIAELMCY